MTSLNQSIALAERFQPKLKPLQESAQAPATNVPVVLEMMRRIAATPKPVEESKEPVKIFLYS